MPGAVAPSPTPTRARASAGAPGHRRRLIAGFQALEQIPSIAESRNRLVDLGSNRLLSPGEVATAVEADVGLTLRVLRAASAAAGTGRSGVASVADAVEALSAERVIELAAETPTVDFFHRGDPFGGELERFRLHGVAVQRAADLLRRELGVPERDVIAAAALLHDVGKLVLKVADDRYRARIDGSGTPEERLQGERRELGLDHAAIGGLVARQWGLPRRLGQAIELHHASDAEGEAGIVRLADMLVHYAHGSAVSASELLDAAGRVGLERGALRRLMYDLPYPDARPTRMDPCPLTSRELDVVRGLATGEVYKEIGDRLSLSASTVRTHLHNAYGKLGVDDRAQAVLVAQSKGWI